MKEFSNVTRKRSNESTETLFTVATFSGIAQNGKQATMCLYVRESVCTSDSSSNAKEALFMQAPFEISN